MLYVIEDEVLYIGISYVSNSWSIRRIYYISAIEVLSVPHWLYLVKIFGKEKFESLKLSVFLHQHLCHTVYSLYVGGRSGWPWLLLKLKEFLFYNRKSLEFSYISAPLTFSSFLHH